MSQSANSKRHKFRIRGQRSQRFLQTLAETGNVTAAAAVAGISRTGAYDHREIDEAFARAWAEAEEIAADKLEAEAWRRGVDGIEEPIISLGKVVAGEDEKPLTIRRYSDTLLLALLRAHRPQLYREKASVEVDISDRLWERLEAARQRAIGTSEVAAVREVLQLEPAAEESTSDASSAETKWTMKRSS